MRIFKIIIIASLLGTSFYGQDSLTLPPVNSLTLEECQKALHNFTPATDDCVRHLEIAQWHYDLFQQEHSIEEDYFYRTVLQWASTLFRCGDIDQAKKLLLENISILDEQLGKKHSITYKLINYYAYLEEKSGNYQKALKYYEESIQRLKIIEGVIPSISKHLRKTNLSVAKLYYKMGLYEQALTLYSKYFDPESPTNTFHKRNNKIKQQKFLANIYRDMGRYEDALPLYIECLDLIELNKEKKDISGQILFDLGQLYNLSGQYEKAILTLEKAAFVFKRRNGSQSGWYGQTMNALGDVFKIIKDYEKSRAAYEIAYQNYSFEYGTNHPYCINYLSNLGAVHSQLENFDIALPYFEKALSIAESSYEEAHPDLIKSLNQLGSFYQKQGETQKAFPNLKKAYDLSKNSLGTNHPDFANYAFHLAQNFEHQGKIEESLSLYKEVIQNAHHRINNQFNYFNEEEQKALLSSFQHYFDQFQSFVWRNGLSEESSEVCLQNSFLLKGLLLNDKKELIQSLRSSDDPLLSDKFKTWEENRKLLARQYSLPIQYRPANFKELEEKNNRLERELARASISFRQKEQQEWHEIKNQLTDTEVAIEFAHFNYYSIDQISYSDSTIYLAYLIRNDLKQPVSIPLFKEKELGSLRAILRLYNFEKRGTRPNLNELIWQPLAPYLENISTIHFAPSGLLHYINIGAIPIEESKIISDHFELHNLQSIQTFNKAAAPSHFVADDAFLFGGIQYETDKYSLAKAVSYNSEPEKDELTASHNLGKAFRAYRGNDWDYLEWSEKEVRNLNNYLTTKGTLTRLLTNYSASEECFKQMGQIEESPRILHLATHGYFFPDAKRLSPKNNSVFQKAKHPMIRSGLILAGANDYWKGNTRAENEEDGILTAFEIAQMDLSHTELVVLSACNTGLGDIKGQEGVYGLQRAFKMAGAKYLLMSLWSVPDQQTHEFMNLFYQKWLGGVDIPAAYQYAQNEMRRKYAAPFDPSVWAGFVLVE